MKTNLIFPTVAAFAALFSLSTTMPANASLSQYGNIAYQNNFSSGTDAGWTRLSNFGLSTGQHWDASTGAYQMSAPPNGTSGYGFVGSIVTGLTITDGYVQSDVVTWQGIGAFGPWGVGSRLSNFLPLSYHGYSFQYEPTTSVIRISRLGPPAIFNNLASAPVSLTPGHQYTLTLETTGSTLVGSMWDVGQVGSVLLASVTANDSTYASGAVALFGVCQTPLPTVDVTFDNFLVMIPEPGTGLLLGLGLLVLLQARRSWLKKS